MFGIGKLHSEPEMSVGIKDGGGTGGSGVVLIWTVRELGPVRS
jgi:hypothetical protein